MKDNALIVATRGMFVESLLQTSNPFARLVFEQWVDRQKKKNGQAWRRYCNIELTSEYVTHFWNQVNKGLEGYRHLCADNLEADERAAALHRSFHAEFFQKARLLLQEIDPLSAQNDGKRGWHKTVVICITETASLELATYLDQINCQVIICDVIRNKQECDSCKANLITHKPEVVLLNNIGDADLSSIVIGMVERALPNHIRRFIRLGTNEYIIFVAKGCELEGPSNAKEGTPPENLPTGLLSPHVPTADGGPTALLISSDNARVEKLRLMVSPEYSILLKLNLLTHSLWVIGVIHLTDIIERDRPDLILIAQDLPPKFRQILTRVCNRNLLPNYTALLIRLTDGDGYVCGYRLKSHPLTEVSRKLGVGVYDASS